MSDFWRGSPEEKYGLQDRIAELERERDEALKRLAEVTALKERAMNDLHTFFLERDTFKAEIARLQDWIKTMREQRTKLRRNLLTVLQREAATTKRHDDRLDLVERERDEAMAALLALRNTTTPEAWVLIVPRIDAILANWSTP